MPLFFWQFFNYSSLIIYELICLHRFSYILNISNLCIQIRLFGLLMTLLIARCYGNNLFHLPQNLYPATIYPQNDLTMLNNSIKILGILSSTASLII